LFTAFCFISPEGIQVLSSCIQTCALLSEICCPESQTGNNGCISLVPVANNHIIQQGRLFSEIVATLLVQGIG
jgi:hypothetical protein